MYLLIMCSVMAFANGNGTNSSVQKLADHSATIIDLDATRGKIDNKNLFFDFIGFINAFNPVACTATVVNVASDEIGADSTALSILEFKTDENGVQIVNPSKIGRGQGVLLVQSNKEEMCEAMEEAFRLQQILFMSVFVPENINKSDLGDSATLPLPLVMQTKYFTETFGSTSLLTLGSNDPSKDLDEVAEFTEELTEDAEKNGEIIEELVREESIQNGPGNATNRAQWRRGIFNEGSGG